MQLNRLSTLAVLALAGVAFQAASAVPMQQPAASTSSPSGVQQASSQEQVSRDKNAAQDPIAATQPGAQTTAGSATPPQPTDTLSNSGPPTTSTAGQLTTTQPKATFARIAQAPELVHGILDYLPYRTRSAVGVLSKDLKHAVDTYPAGQPDILDLCLARKWTALLASDGVQQLKEAVDRTTAATIAAKAELAAARANAAANPGTDYGVVGLTSAAWFAEKEEEAAKEAFHNVVAANVVWGECVTEAYPSATIKQCPHSEYQIVGNNGEYTPPVGPYWYPALEMAQTIDEDSAREKTFASQLCQLAENDAFYWAEQLVKDAPDSFRAVGLYALIHTVQLTKDKRTAEQVHAILQRVSAPSGLIPLSLYYDPVVEHYLFNCNPSLLPMVYLDPPQLLSGILARALVISKRPLPYLAPWYKADRPTELDMPRVHLPVADSMAVMRSVAECMDRSIMMAPYPAPYKDPFPESEQPGPGDAYQLLTLPDQSLAMPEKYGMVHLPYKGTEKEVHPFDLVVGYYTTDEAIEFYNAAYKDTYYPAAVAMAARSTDGTKLLEHVFAHQVGKPGTNFLGLPHVVSYMTGLRGGYGDRWREREAWICLGEAVMDCAEVFSKNQWPTFEKLMVERLSTLTPAQMDRFASTVWISGAKGLLEENAEVKELPLDQCTTFEQRHMCAVHRVASLLRQGKSAVQAN